MLKKVVTLQTKLNDNMNKKKNLFNAFTKSVIFNYHLIETEEPNGHLIYLIKNGSILNTDTLEFSPTTIVENLVRNCGIKIEKIAPGIFFTEEINTDNLKYMLDNKLSQNIDFSTFIESIKDEYRILEIKDSLLFKKDPKEYEKNKYEEYQKHQKELWDEMVEQINNKKQKRIDSILAYENNLLKLMKDYFESIIEYEKRDFKFNIEFDKFLANFIDPETWIKINNVPFICRSEIISFEKDYMNVFLTDNNDYSYTATLRFNNTVFITENVIKIEKDDNLPKFMTDYDFIAKLYNIDTDINDWVFKNDTDRFEYVIDYIVPILKESRLEKEKNIIDNMKKDSVEEDTSE